MKVLISQIMTKDQMDKPIDTFSDIALQVYGAITLAALFYLGKILKWCGRKIAEGANKDLVEKLMPSIAEYVESKIKEFKDDTIRTLTSELAEVKKSVEKYKNVKHNIETENKYLKQMIQENDEELIKIIREHLNEKK